MRRLLFAYVIFFFSVSLFAEPSPVLHYTHVANVLDQLPPTCTPCAEFFFVERPLTGTLIHHAFVAGRYTKHCEENNRRSQMIAHVEYGLNKGSADLEYFDAQHRAGIYARGLTFVGQVCGMQDVLRAESVAAAETRRWEQWQIESYGYYWSMLGAPLTGRPCANAARAVASELQSKAL